MGIIIRDIINSSLQHVVDGYYNTSYHQHCHWYQCTQSKTWCLQTFICTYVL